ncbi:probable phytol kinase 2, chloroplastic isoform X2 [Salvia miltiorrhiza]|uniref:probable phytol kinase 2, chloroplastic isoform X2 n=1 Tax=Salvia miltiorrhiza TaxID=226208 RepID=UPI0025AC5A8E|nr:probable phytol kinase 2, chloroplastic isoform X2 [Salvia miltiorrhiza]
MFSNNVVISDIIAGGLSVGITVSLLKLLEQTATRGVFEQKLNRKLVHISFGLVFMLCWPMFSSGRLGAVVASLIPGMNIINMLLLGFGIWKNDATVKSMTRNNDHRELLKGPLYYASALTLFTAIYWRTSPIAIAGLCNAWPTFSGGALAAENFPTIETKPWLVVSRWRVLVSSLLLDT